MLIASYLLLWLHNYEGWKAGGYDEGGYQNVGLGVFFVQGLYVAYNRVL